jgi:NodT family efflux transporter outer membrane factor (OMF) lipoprotein
MPLLRTTRTRHRPPLPGRGATPAVAHLDMSHRRVVPSRLAAMTVVVVAWAVTGCSTPPAPLSPNTAAVSLPYRHAPAATTEGLDAATWRGFGDPVLDGLLARARAANLDVRIAVQRVREARAGSTAAASRLWPTVAATGSVSDQRTALPDDVKRGMPDTRALRGAIDLGWEVDVFGAAAAAADAAELDALAADAGAQAAQWLATTELAHQYLVWHGARVRLQQLQVLLQAQQDTERLTRSRQAQGLASAFDVSRAVGEVQTLAAQLPPLRTLVAVTEHQIQVLLGSSPGAADSDWRDAAVALPSVPVLAPGQPVDLLQRRPDLRVAQQQLLAESARLRESQADLWPKFFIAAVLGRQDLRLNALDLSPGRYSNVALAFTAPLFNAGRLRAAVERQSIRERGATLQYERAVLMALQDVENSLVALAQERERGQALAAAVQSRRTGLRHAESLHREGQIDLLQLLDAQRGLIAAELAATDSHTQRLLGAVQLVKALGGGWYAAPALSASTTLEP